LRPSPNTSFKMTIYKVWFCITLVISGVSQAHAEDALDLMNVLQGEESEFVFNTAEFSQWKFGKVSGLENPSDDPNLSKTARFEDNNDNPFGTEDSSGSDDISSSQETITGKKTARTTSNIQVSRMQKENPSSVYVSSQSPFTLKELLESFRSNGFEIILSKEAQELQHFRYKLFFDKAPIGTVLRWLAATTGRQVELQNQKIIL